ncbi:13280_t:CDS:2, partial [Acaulospora colombiana]
MSRNNPVLRPRYTPSTSSQLQDTAEQSLSMQAPVDPDESMPAASDFVRKLFRMLEDPAYSSIVCWGSQRDCFIVKDMTEFTKVILPRLFKHSNFASFVRQLNKYDFHKVKNTDENAYGEHCWTFRHPKFRADQLEGLEDIKRKSAPTRRGSTRPNQPARSKSPSDSQLHHDMGESPL